jgi:CheY-like chemotaxis protein
LLAEQIHDGAGCLVFVFSNFMSEKGVRMMRILLVEDNELNRDMLSRRLVRLGYKVELATNGRDAAETAETVNPDIILMDMSLPIMNGWDAARLLKNNPATASIPIIGLSAHASAEDRERALDMGCDDYETKPIELERLVSKIKTLTN